MVPSSSSRHGSQSQVGTSAWLMQALGCHLLLMQLLLADRMSARLWRALGCHLLQKLLWRALGCHLLQKRLLLALVDISSQHCLACNLRVSRGRCLERPTGRPGPSSFQQSTVRCRQLQVTQVPTRSSQAQGEGLQPVLLSDQDHQPQPPAVRQGQSWQVCSNLSPASESQR